MSKCFTTEDVDRNGGGKAKKRRRLTSDWPVLLVTPNLSAPLYCSHCLQTIYAELNVHVNNTHWEKTSKTFMRRRTLLEEGRLPKTLCSLSAYACNCTDELYTHTFIHSKDTERDNVLIIVPISILGWVFSVLRKLLRHLSNKELPLKKENKSYNWLFLKFLLF